MLHPAIAAEREALLALFGVAAGRLATLMPGVESDADIEALHQMRVELRRLRAALGVLEGYAAVPDAAELVNECRWLAGHGSGLRDMDVLIERLPDYLGAAPDAADPLLRLLLRDIGRLRSRERRAMLGAFRSRRGHALVARLEALAGLPVHEGEWPGDTVLAAATRRALRKLCREGKALAPDAPAEAWHGLRKRAKRCRYLLELHAGMEPPKAAQDLMLRVRRLQNALGDHQDFDIHGTVIEDLLQSPEARRNPEYAALLQKLLLGIRGRMPRARERAASRLQGLLRSRARKRVLRRLSPERQPQTPWIGTGGYCHAFAGPTPCHLPVGKVVCVGRNYAAHAAELGNAVPDKPLLFIKPPSSVVDLGPSLRVPVDRGSVHHETEIAVLIGRALCNARPEEALAAILGVGVALDLTLREVQDALKAKGQPWEISKGFDGACALSTFQPMTPDLDLTTLQIRLVVNGRRRQFASSAQMITPVIELLCLASRHFTLWPGDVLLTGTPAGVGPLVPGDKLLAEVAGVVSVRSVVS